MAQTRTPKGQLDSTLVDTTTSQTVTGKDLSTGNTFPTFNQNTTGSAATLTTARTIQTDLTSTTSASFNGSANITPGVTGALAVANGGTGRATSTTAYGVIAAGTTATGALQTISPGTSGQFLKSAGASALASFATISSADLSDVSSLVTLTGTQTLASKTLTSPTINTPTITWTNNTVTAAALATNAITLGYAQSTTTFTLSTAQTTPTQVTGLSASVTIPSGGRRVKITAFTSSLSPAAGVAVLTIWDGTVNTGTQISQYNSAANNGATCIAVVTPAAGSKTYNVGVSNSGANNTSVSGTATAPSFILVETI